MKRRFLSVLLTLAILVSTCTFPVMATDNSASMNNSLLDYTGNFTLDSVPEKPNKIVNVVSGIHVYWNAIDGVSKYGLWRSEAGQDGTYTWIANPTTWHFTDTNVKSGKTYYYKITVLDTTTNTHSEKSDAIGITYTATPDITSRFNKAAGIQIGWEKIPGATGYAIYRKSYSGTDAWTRVATVDDGDTLSWIDTSVKNSNGSIYKYTIRALSGTTLSGCRNTGRTMVRLSSRTLSSAVRTNTSSIKCTWTTSSAVTGYEVRFMTNNTVYKTYTIGNYKTGTKTFTGLPTGQTYKIQVRAYKKVDSVGSFYSAWSTAENVTLDDQTNMVWIPTNGGKKYHCKSSCSNMIDPEYVSLSEAIERGFTACGRCY